MGQPSGYHLRLLSCVSLIGALLLAACTFIAVKPRFAGHLFAASHAHGFDGNTDLKAITSEGDFGLLAGFWTGAIEQVDLRILFRITAQGDVYNYSLDQGGVLIPAGTTTFDEETGKTTFWFPTVGGTYHATLDMDDSSTGNKNELVGTWSQAGYKLALNMHRYQPPVNPDDDDDSLNVPYEYRFLLEKSVFGDGNAVKNLAGYWSGETAAGGDPDDPPETVILHVEKITDGLAEPKVFLPDETPIPFEVRSLYFDATGRTKLVVNTFSQGNAGVTINAVFEGQLGTDGKTIAGELLLDDQEDKAPLVLTWSFNFPPSDDSAEMEITTDDASIE